MYLIGLLRGLTEVFKCLKSIQTNCRFADAPKGQTLTPHIPRNAKLGYRFHHERTGALLYPAGYEWANEEYVIEFMLHSSTKWITRSRTKSKLCNGQLQVAGDQWPVFLYANYSYDAEDPWNGLLHSGLLISVSFFYYLSSSDSPKLFTGLQTRLYFTKFHRSRTESHSIW